MKDHAAIIIKDGTKILFIKRSQFKKTLPNIWSFPSGTKEDYETIYQTAERESLEELGIIVKAESLLTIKDLPDFKVKLHFIICSIIDGFPEIKDPSEIQELQWLTFKDFFEKYTDSEIGHGLIFLRQQPNLWKG